MTTKKTMGTWISCVLFALSDNSCSVDLVHNLRTITGSKVWPLRHFQVISAQLAILPPFHIYGFVYFKNLTQTIKIAVARQYDEDVVPPKTNGQDVSTSGRTAPNCCTLQQVADVPRTVLHFFRSSGVFQSALAKYFTVSSHFTFCSPYCFVHFTVFLKLYFLLTVQFC